MLVNTEKGAEVCEKISNTLYMCESSFDKIARKNGQLLHPSTQSNRRGIVMEIYQNNGYKGIETWFHTKYRKQIAIHTIYNLIPRKPRILLKKLLKK